MKQTAAVATMILLGTVILDRRRTLTLRAILGALPLRCVVATILTMKVVFPTVYRALVWGPSQYRVDRREFAKYAWQVLYLQPLFWVALLDALRRGRAPCPSHSDSGRSRSRSS